LKNNVPRRDSHTQNLHVVNPDIKVHSVVSSELDYNHEYAMTVPLGECNDEQLLAEVARRHLGMIESSLNLMMNVKVHYGELYVCIICMIINYILCVVFK
jgi:hypothetical protein